jgi:hypothetical protein
MKRYVLYGLAALGVIFIIIQFIPVARTNPPVEADMGAPAEVAAILRRSCYDCHSHETKWPWYNRIAPGSWLIAHDVKEAREHLNFSTWNRYSNKDRAELIEEIWEEVDAGKMPLWFYVPLHPEARLSEEDQAVLQAWSERTSRNYQAAADVEEATRDFLKETEKALEDAAREVMKATERALKEAEDALKRAEQDAEREGDDRPGGDI